MKLHKGDSYTLAESTELIRDLVEFVKDPTTAQSLLELNLITNHGEGLDPLIFRLGSELVGSEIMIVNLQEEYYGVEARVLAPLKEPFSGLAGPILFVPDEA